MTTHLLAMLTLTLACNTKDSAENTEDSAANIEDSHSDDTDDSNDTDDPEDTDDTEDTDITVDVVPGLNEMVIEQMVEGELIERRYFLDLPQDYDGSGSTPVLFAFHGSGGSGENFIGAFTPSVQAGEIIGVYPDGLENSWNIEREDSKADDTAFTELILGVLETIPGIDTSNPIATGFSNGAALIHKISIETDLFSGIAPQVSQLLISNQPVSDSAKVSVMQFSGTDDNACPYDGGIGVLGYEFMNAEDSTAAWAAANGCDATATETDIDPHVKMEWENCDNGRRVIHYRLNGVGHMVPPDVDGGANMRIIEFLLESRQ